MGYRVLVLTFKTFSALAAVVFIYSRIDIFAYSFYYHFLFVLLSLLFHYELTSARCRLSNSDPLVFASPTLSQTPWLLACCLNTNQRTLEPLPRSPRRARNPLALNLRIRSTFSSRVCTIVATRACSLAPEAHPKSRRRFGSYYPR